MCAVSRTKAMQKRRSPPVCTRLNMHRSGLLVLCVSSFPSTQSHVAGNDRDDSDLLLPAWFSGPMLSVLFVSCNVHYSVRIGLMASVSASVDPATRSIQSETVMRCAREYAWVDGAGATIPPFHDVDDTSFSRRVNPAPRAARGGYPVKKFLLTGLCPRRRLLCSISAMATAAELAPAAASSTSAAVADDAEGVLSAPLAPTSAADATALRNVALLTAWVVSPVLLPIPVPAQMLVLALLVIHIASERAAVSLLARQADPSTDKEERDVISGAAAYRFPVMASCALLGLFLAFKYLPASVVAVLIGIYGLSLGSLALSSVLSPILAAVPGMPDWARATHSFFNDFVEVSAVDVGGLVLAVPVAVLYARTKLWLANNILAVSLALSAIEMLALGDFKSGAVLLSGLFFYDIFWVFGSKRVFGANVMVTVAKKFDGPIKLLFPKAQGFRWAAAVRSLPTREFSMLGLGDIVIPGLFVALLLRWDMRHTPVAPAPAEGEEAAPPTLVGPRPYYHTVLVGYTVGLVVTLVALNVFDAAQPALLYIVPACLLASVGLALYRGEMRELWAYTEEEEEEEEEKEKEANAVGPPASGENKKDL